MKKLTMKVLAICLSAFMCFGMYPIITFASSTTETITVTGTYDYSRAYEVLELVNEERTAEGLSPVTMDQDLMDAAMQRAAECSVYFDHTRPSGESCFTISKKAFAENIAAGQSTASAVMTSWMNSSGHKANILGSKYQSIGIGCFIQGRTVYWVQLFGIESAAQASQPSNQEVSVSVVIDPDLVGWSPAEEDPIDTKEEKPQEETPQPDQEQDSDNDPQSDEDDTEDSDTESEPDREEVEYPDEEPSSDDEVTGNSDTGQEADKDLTEDSDTESEPDEDLTEDSDSGSQTEEQKEDVSSNDEAGDEEVGETSEQDEDSQEKSMTEGDTTKEEPQTDSEEPSYGFSVSQLSSSDTFKVDDAYSTHADGTNTYQIYFYADSSEQWIDDNVTFTVEDVTSSGMLSVMEDAGIPYVEPIVTIASAKDVSYVCPPITENGPDYSVIEAISGKEIIVEAGQSTRCIKTTAYKDGTVIDYVYSRCAGGSDGGYAAADKELFERACASIEAQLWSENMTNLEKLQVFAEYISSVSHYPNTDTTNAAYNPEWAAIWNEDGITDYRLLWGDFADQYVDWTMALQGGQSTDLAVNMLYEIALNDLGLTGITADDTGAGEGVYVGGGTNGTSLSGGSDNSLVYQATDGTRTSIDAQGMSYSAGSPYVTCSAHGCQDKIIPISGYTGNYDQSEGDNEESYTENTGSEEVQGNDASDFGESDETEVDVSDNNEEEYMDTTEEVSPGEDENADDTDGVLVTLEDGENFTLPESAEKEPTTGIQPVKTGDTKSLILYIILVACGIVILCSSMLLIRKYPK